MNSLAWLVGLRVQAVSRRESDWQLTFDNGASLVVECLRRLLANGRIRLTSADDRQRFGLATPVDAVAQLSTYLCASAIEHVELHQTTLDLELQFNSGHLLQIIPNTSGYEAWNAQQQSRHFIAMGGGELTIFDH